ncbi:MAG: DUF1361 domain-containing protein [Patescibacteria group bacterium]|nr:DUF1361 domain-containing protein [Patescibacteria group bacterium]
MNIFFVPCYFISFLNNEVILLYNLNINGYPLFCVFWNLFLVFIAFLITRALILFCEKNNLAKTGNKIFVFLLGILWLVFIPNTAYLVVIIRHLLNFCPDNYYRVCVNNAWMVPFFFIYALIGWIFFVILTRRIKNLISGLFGGACSKIFIICVIPLISLGVLLGLINRWNSWELFINPIIIAEDVYQYLSQASRIINWAAFTLFFYLLYYIGNIVLKDKKK